MGNLRPEDAIPLPIRGTFQTIEQTTLHLESLPEDNGFETEER
jgi:hypothetical protein